MKQLQVQINIMYAIDVEDNFDYTDSIAVNFAVQNYLRAKGLDSSIEFLSNIKVVCRNCGIALYFLNEQKAGICAGCKK